MELRAERGRAVLVGAPELFQPTSTLAGALDEWAEVAAAVCSADDADDATAELVSARGRQLAARLAAATGLVVRYADPVRGVLEPVAAEPPQRPWPWPLPAVDAGPRADPEEPTPWATGLVCSAFTAPIVLAAVVTLVRGLAEVSWLLGAVALVAVTAGLAPSVWLARNTPMWRWVSYGVAGGLALSWLALLLSTLGT